MKRNFRLSLTGSTVFAGLVFSTFYGQAAMAQVTDGIAAIADMGAAAAIGDGSSASGDGAVAVGENASANGSDALAVGTDSNADGNSTSAVGGESTATGPGASAFGWRAMAIGERSTALGHLARAEGVRVGGSSMQASLPSSVPGWRRRTCAGWMSPMPSISSC